MGSSGAVPSESENIPINPYLHYERHIIHIEIFNT